MLFLSSQTVLLIGTYTGWKNKMNRAARKWLVKAANVQENPYVKAKLLWMVLTYG